MNWLRKMAQIMNAVSVLKFLQENGYWGYLKYVRVNGEYRFAEAGIGPDHATLANGEPVESAGFIKSNTRGFYVEGHSSVLKIGPAEDDERNLSALLGLPIRSKWDE